MPEESGQERTESATPRKRQKAREQGQVAKSMEVNTALILITAMMGLNFLSTYMFKSIADVSRAIIMTSSEISLLNINVQHATFYFIAKLFMILAPFMLLILVIGIASNYAQIGFLITFETMKPKLSKLNPINGFSRLFSKKSAVELIKSIFKMTVVFYIIYISLKGEYVKFYNLADSSIEEIFIFTAKLTYDLGLRVAIAMLIMALMDYAFQRYQYEEELKMTKQEIKEEMKDVDGDPQIKAKIRQIQREMAQQRMMSEVPNADVVVTNPTHYAVAVKYDSKNMRAPIVVAKGVDFVAQRIKDIALENDVPIVENKFLARSLYKFVEIGDEIPEEFFKATAEILAYVYKLKKKKTG